MCVCHHNSGNLLTTVLTTNLCTYLLDEGEFVGIGTSVGGSVRPAAVGEVDDLNCLND